MTEIHGLEEVLPALAVVVVAGACPCLALVRMKSRSRAAELHPTAKVRSHDRLDSRHRWHSARCIIMRASTSQVDGLLTSRLSRR
jgi:hypothetical protein